jgi:hypothetical protein
MKTFYAAMAVFMLAMSLRLMSFGGYLPWVYIAFAAGSVTPWVLLLIFRFRKDHGAYDCLDCDEVKLQFRLHLGLTARMEKEISLLRVAVTRYCDKSRMGTIEPMEVQQAVDRAFTDEPV